MSNMQASCDHETVRKHCPRWVSLAALGTTLERPTMQDICTRVQKSEFDLWNIRTSTRYDVVDHDGGQWATYSRTRHKPVS